MVVRKAYDHQCLRPPYIIRTPALRISNTALKRSRIIKRVKDLIYVVTHKVIRRERFESQCQPSGHSPPATAANFPITGIRGSGNPFEMEPSSGHNGFRVHSTWLKERPQPLP